MTGPGSAAGTVPSDRAGCLALDAADPLAGLRETIADDDRLLETAGAMFDGLLATFEKATTKK